MTSEPKTSVGLLTFKDLPPKDEIVKLLNRRLDAINVNAVIQLDLSAYAAGRGKGKDMNSCNLF